MSIAAQLNPSNLDYMLCQPPQAYEWLRFDPNNDCNLHCAYCHNGRSKDSIEETTLRQFLEHNVVSTVGRAPMIASRQLVACGSGDPLSRRIRGALGQQTREALNTEK